MSLADEYGRQFRWRPWSAIVEALPPLAGRTVLDLGCAIGDQAVLLAARGARVIGVDANEELLREARARGLANVEFRKGDLSADLSIEEPVDGVWCSFVAAYFPDLGRAVEAWRRHLRPGGWMALTEIDDLFGHEPLGARTKALLGANARDALAAGRYDFHMGRKLRGHLERSGFNVTKEMTLADRELSFDGPAPPEVIEAWRLRFDRMKPLQEACGPEFGQVRGEFLAALARADHRCAAKVYCCLAEK